MDGTARVVETAADALRPRRSVFLVFGAFVLLAGQYYLRMLFDVTGGEAVFAAPDALLGALLRPARWAAALVADPATMGDLAQFVLVLCYVYLLAAAVATVGEFVAAAL